MSTGAAHVVLIGMMATGKTSVGRIVADALALPLFDSDEQIEARTGRTVREIWREDGEPVFRTLEAEALADALGSGTPSVVAAAGGVVLAEENRKRLADAHATVFWLDAQPATLVERLRAAGDEHRPLLDDDLEGTLERMYRERRPLYQEVADHVVDVDGRSRDDVATEILALVRS